MTAPYRSYVRNGRFMLSVALGLAMLALSLVVNFYAAAYAFERASAPVTDIILSNIPVFDVDGIFLVGPVVLWLFVAVLCIARPERIPFVLKTSALFIAIRAAFITLTHLGPFPDQIQINYTSDLIRIFTTGGDLFFSGHTGYPYLMALIFWKDVRLRIVFIASAILFGAVVLMAHLHYSIDVMAAFFITFAIYHIATHWFPNDHRLFERGLETSNGK